MFVVTSAEFTAEDTAYVIINRCIPLWGFPRTILPDNGLHLYSNISHAIYNLLEVRNFFTSPYYPNVSGGVGRVNYTTAQMPAIVVNKIELTWDK